MFKSIVHDIQYSFRSGNMITRLIIINVIVFVFLILLKAFTPAGNGFYATLESYLALPGDPLKILTRPWTLITHMFIHNGFWHVLWNMLFLFWFGKITGDLLGDHRILPLYLVGGLVGAFAYLISYQFLPGIGIMALGASAAVMAIVVAAGLTAPDYIMRLILIGDVKLKYIVLVVLLMDIIGATGQINSGGHIAHLGGAAFGLFFVRQLRQGVDILYPIGTFLSKIKAWYEGQQNRPPKHKKPSPLTVKYKSAKTQRKNNVSSDKSFQEKLDIILDKIKEKGYDSLNSEEKEFLFQASKK